MKKYITIAALLAAGTAFASADVTMSFNTAAEGSASMILDSDALSMGNPYLPTLTYSVVTNDIDQETQMPKSVDLKKVGNNNAFFAPNINVGTADGWTATFYYMVNEELTVDGITLDTGIFSGSYVWQTSNAGSRDFVFTVELMTMGGSDSRTMSSGNWTIKANGTNTPENGVIDLIFGEAIILKQRATLIITVDRGTSNDGCFLGLNSVTFSTAAIPEPSAFGLLAGIGALALVASRRRRK